MKLKKNIPLFAAAALCATALFINPSFAADSSSADWVNPVADKVTGLKDSLTELAVAVVALILVVFGIWTISTNHFDTRRFLFIILGCIIITAAGFFGEYWFAANSN